MPATPAIRPSMATKMAVAPSPPRRPASVSIEAGLNASLPHDPQIADNHTMTIDITRYAFSNRRVKILHGGQRQGLVFGRLHNRRAKGMLASPLQTGGKPQHICIGKSCRCLERDNLRLAFSERAGLVGHNRVDALEAAQALLRF